MRPPPILFTADEARAANVEWGANCGPCALAAACVVDLDVVREVMLEFEERRWTNPTMIEEALHMLVDLPGEEAGSRWFRVIMSSAASRGFPHLLPVDGIVRVQYEGNWLEPGVPAKAAYKYTHWAAVCGEWVFCTLRLENEWRTQETWRADIAQHCREQGYRGWLATHHYEIRRRILDVQEGDEKISEKETDRVAGDS